MIARCSALRASGGKLKSAPRPVMLRLSLPVVLLAALAPLPGAESALPPLPADEDSRRLIQRWRDRQEWLADTEANFLGVVQASSTLMDLGKVGFILEQIGGRARRYLNRNDHEWVFDAVEGQSAAEMERNLPAIVTYLQLGTASELYWRLARANKPPFGQRKGLLEIRGIAKGVFDFRNEQAERVRRGRIAADRVLTAGNLGEFGSAEKLKSLRAAFRAGRNQFVNQRNLAVLVVVAFELTIGLLIALVFLRPRPALITELNAG